MTERDLTTLLHDHVTHDEPPTPLPTRAIADGRRRIRRRRLGLAGGALAAIALAGAVVVPLRSGDEPRESVMDPASVDALAEYDALRMPELMDEHVRRVLERSVPDLGPSTFIARDDQWTPIPRRHWDKASRLSVSYGSREHEWEVSISHARGEAEGGAETYCASELAGGFALECTVERTDDGDVVIKQLQALTLHRTFGRLDPNMPWGVVRAERIASTRLDELWFERHVKVIKSATLLTYVEERVKVTDRDPEAAPFRTSYDDLVEIGTDPTMVMPRPPDENGCGWTWKMEVRCIRR
ncbi:MAG TPA: hypothetical protein VMF51_14470 [Nocardioides sp.]|uniref:hypothetical protein n=1 Tax=Nocardioides sp. TaxID=35761 RepID=UPI002B69CE80|nr:hypothetical protein [Nocardioides sp.]HTW16336.1 hypothetical protein [Nocardioides sp.]